MLSRDKVVNSMLVKFCVQISNLITRGVPKMHQFYSVLFCALLLLNVGCARHKTTTEQVSDSTALTNKIDALFVEWNKASHPGGVVGVYKEGKLIYNKAFGLASIEYNAPNTVQTRFNIASVSKQFTAYAIFLLEQRGKLSLNDDIRLYLPEVPNYGTTITVKHLIQHTSGLRSFHAILGMAGWRRDDRRTHDDLMRIIAQGNTLNFEPGSEYMYSNTGFIFAAMIIERVTETAFRAWMQENVFDVFKMQNTFVSDDIDEVLLNAASSYIVADGKIQRVAPYWEYYGSGNIYSTTADILKWAQNFSLSNLNDKSLFKEMSQNGILNSGEQINYGSGVFSEEYRGHKLIQHGGAVGGFRSRLDILPEHDTQIAILTNFNQSNVVPSVHSIKDILLNIDPEESNDQREGVPKDTPISPTLDELSKLQGHYFSSELDTYYRIYLREDQLALSHIRHGEHPMTFIQGDTYQVNFYPMRDLVFMRDESGNILGLHASNSRVRNVWLEKVE
jgi:CubicO group peptidase (beta-lactamase class C family)